MKTEVVIFPNMDEEITYYIGTNAKDNFDVIDMGDLDDVWFHSNTDSSCHVVCNMPETFNKKEKSMILNKGAFLCKINTGKLKSIPNSEIMCAFVKDVEKTKTMGCVNVKKVIKIIKV
jgi:predicted ribosome quality control (RQC) complex YloA/Tae2 family protein